MIRARTLEELAPADLAAFRELASRAGRRAAQSLGLLMGQSDGLGASDFQVAGSTQVAGALGNQHAVAVMFKLAGGVNGLFWLLGPQEDMLRLAQRLLGTPALSSNLDEASRGALAEAGNVVASSFINVFGDTLREVCFPSVPDVRHAPARVLGRLALDATESVGLVKIKDSGAASFTCALLFCPDPLSLGVLTEAIRASQGNGASEGA